MDNKYKKEADISIIEHILYFNEFGVIFKDCLIINNDDTNIIVNNTEIKNVILKKESNFRWEAYIKFILILFLGVFFYGQKQIIESQELEVITIVYSISTIIFYLNKKMNYALIFFLNNKEIRLKVMKNSKYQARSFMVNIKRNIRKKNEINT